MQRHQVPVSACNHWIDRPGHSRTCFDSSGETRRMDALQALENVLYHRMPDVSCWGKLYRREVLEGIQYPEGKLYEDTWTFSAMMQKAGAIAWTPKPMYHYRIRSDSISRSVWGPEKMDFVEAVSQLTGSVRAMTPTLENGCIRREAHAWMSVRRYYVSCTESMKTDRSMVDKQILKRFAHVLHDPHAPLRDKVAMLALRFGGDVGYDALWKLSQK